MGEVMCGPNTDHKRCYGWHMTTQESILLPSTQTSLRAASMPGRIKKLTDGLSLPGLLSVCEGPGGFSRSGRVSLTPTESSLTPADV